MKTSAQSPPSIFFSNSTTGHDRRTVQRCRPTIVITRRELSRNTRVALRRRRRSRG